MKKLLAILSLVLLAGISKGQYDSTKIMIGWIENGDTIIEQQLKEIWVFPGMNSMSKRQKRRFWREVYRIKKVYPYAKKANHLLEIYEPEYNSLESKHDKKRLMKKIENELLAEHKKDLKKMSIKDGRVLIKLIDRETGHTSYNLIRDFRGEFAAFFWQAIAKIFKNDLKSEYDPEGEDRLIEEVVRLIEAGQI